MESPCSKCNANCCVDIGYIYLSCEEYTKLKEIKPDLEAKHVSNDYYIHSPCPFLKDNKCSIYDVRPEICQSYPLVAEPLELNEEYVISFMLYKCRLSDAIINKEIDYNITDNIMKLVEKSLRYVDEVMKIGIEKSANTLIDHEFLFQDNKDHKISNGIILYNILFSDIINLYYLKTNNNTKYIIELSKLRHKIRNIIKNQ